MSGHKVISFGEVLWDLLPQGRFLGGAPLNAACHLARLGCHPQMVSAVGVDDLGDEALERVSAHGVDTRFIARHADLPTGTVEVSLDPEGVASYTIREGVAWDRIEAGEELFDAAWDAGAFVFGSLAMRTAENVAALQSLFEVPGPMRVFDVNLRAPYDDIDLVLRLVTSADLLKVNQEELFALLGPGEGKGRARPVKADEVAYAARALIARYSVPHICVTLGGDGALFLDLEEVEPVWASAPAVEVRDTVGAGDAFLAALVAGLLAGEHPGAGLLDRCCRLGALVASRDGAVPDYDPAEIFG